MWVNVLLTAGSFMYYIQLAFNIPYSPEVCIMKVKQTGFSFMEWLVKFVEKNKIEFPPIEIFFMMLICGYLHEGESEISLKDCILRARNSIFYMLEENIQGKDYSEDNDKFNSPDQFKEKYEGGSWLKRSEINIDNIGINIEEIK